MLEVAGDWQRLGAYLIHRRLDLGYRKRSVFQASVAVSPGERRTILDVETGNRSSFHPGTIAWLEHIYRWRPGSVAAVLAGGDPEPLDGSTDKGVGGDGVVVALNGNRRARARGRRKAVDGLGPDEILEARLRLGKTQAEMAKIAQVSHRTYANWENGRNVPLVGKIGPLLGYLRAQGLMSDGDSGPSSVEHALLDDPALSPRDRFLLLDLYRRLTIS